MSIHLFNTLSGSKEIFKPINLKKVRMYSCGPTVYNYAHIGNLRAYVFVDILRRTFEYNDYEVRHVMNITDVGHLTSDSDDGDDKMVKALKRDGKPFTLEAMREVADFYSIAFKEDLKLLNCETPHEMPKASENIDADIEIIKTLTEKGFAYNTSDGVYFDTKKFVGYGKLGKINMEGQLAGARVALNSEKKSPADFSLWKKSNIDIGWESPWGKGFPGWHIECSAMARKFLGQPFDVHTGGIDHIPVHHNNEIAQSEAAFGVPLANYWLHNEFVNINEGNASAQGFGAQSKMAKSGDNFLTLKSLQENGIPPLAYRYFILLAGYHTPINFHEDVVKKIAVTSLDKIYRALSELPENGNVSQDYANKFRDAINNDLNTADGLSLVYKVLSDISVSPADKLATILDFDRVLGLDFEKGRLAVINNKTLKIPEDVSKLLSDRNEARAKKDWKKSDELRQLIESRGFKIKDTDAGTTLEWI